ncbi:conjugal transfer protein TraN [Vibrio cholerae]
MKGKLIYLFWLALLVPSLAYSNIFDQSNPARWVCGSDLNGNGYLGEEGETAACIGNAPSNYCPIGAAQCVLDYDKQVSNAKCPSGSTLNGSVCESYLTQPITYTCNAGWTREGAAYCSRYTNPSNPIKYCSMGTPPSSCLGGYLTENSSTCSYSCRTGGNGNRTYWTGNVNYGCSSGQYYIGGSCYNKETINANKTCSPGYYLSGSQCVKKVTSTPLCDAGFSFNASTKQCEKIVTKDVCPFGEQYQCVPNGGAKYCSPNKCVDKKDPANEEAKDVDGNMLVDDGKRNDQGLCLDQVYIYNGRGQRCLKSGIETAFQNCCKDKGKVFQDGAGAYSSIGTASQTISGLYSVAEMAYVTYSAQTAAGVSSAFAAELAASAAQQQLLIAFDPTTIAISVAMHFVMEWVMNACDQMDMETAMAHSSGYCVEVGEYCKKKIKFIGCVQKARSFCCFNSKLARIIQEQGRPQLTTVNGFGTPSEPNCRGFTPEEFQRIDFAKIDLGEYIEELQKHTQEQVQQNIQQVTEDFFNKVK